MYISHIFNTVAHLELLSGASIMAEFYGRLREHRKDNDELAACVERVVSQLDASATTDDRPGMLLGKIQSGKTRGFVGVIARVFDRGFDIALVLTKGTKTLSAQTVARLKADFAEFIEQDELIVIDIMKPPGKLTKGELKRKIVIVAKKQTQNLARLIEFMRSHPGLQQRRVLLVDDEADLASIRFVRKRGETTVDQGKIAEQIDELRRMVEKIVFLQVTATPYSLYLQPEEYEATSTSGNFIFKPKKPAFTELLPIHSGYVGGDDYFGRFDEDDPRSRLVVEVTAQEQDALRCEDRRRISYGNVLNTPNTSGLRRAISTFVLAVCIRRWQQHQLKEKKLKYAMIIHNDTQKAAHDWQNQVIDWLFDAIICAAEKLPDQLRPLFDLAFDDLQASVSANKGLMPERENAFMMFIEAFQSEDVVREKVNSDREVMDLLDENAELHLRTPFNIFVGGNILDRGITIPQLIAFYYGRNPQTMQADTVLQHSRMYGNRDRKDLSVTRFYTSSAVYNRLYTINGFENALRHAFETGAHDKGVVFIQTDAKRRVKPCAPNKVLLSGLVAIRPNGMLLPTGFTTQPLRNLKPAQAAIDSFLRPEWINTNKFIPITRKDALDLIDLCEASFKFDDNNEFEWNAMRGLIDYYSGIKDGGDGQILLLAETGRKLSREKSGDKSGLSILGTALRSVVLDPNRSKPALIMLQQEGSVELGWSGNKFWWPVFAVPANVEPCVFASRTSA